MRPTKPSVRMLIAPMAMTLLMGLSSCIGVGGYVEEGPEWDGVVVVGGGHDRGYDRDYHPQAFRNEGGPHPAAAGSARGRASLGARAGGGGHAPSGGGRR
jgi:hypothetical protein